MTGSAGPTITARATWRCAGRSPTCCSRSRAGAPPPNWASKCSATPRSGTAGWSARRSEWRTFTTMTTSEIATVLAWHDALNEQDFDTLLVLSSDDIEVGDANGAAQGHTALLDWARSSGIRAEPGRMYVRDGVVVVEQAITSAEGNTAAATAFRVVHDHITSVFRHNDLASAL